MRKQGFLRRFAISLPVLAVASLHPCRGAACCAPGTQTANAGRFSSSLAEPGAQDQAPANPSPQNPAPAAPHKIKIWTNEELISTRTPADIYLFQKEANAAATDEQAFNTLASCFAFHQAEGNAEETQREIDSTERSIRDSEAAVSQSGRALRNSPENLRLRNQMELAQRTSELNHARERLWKLQEHLQELQKLPAQATAPIQQLPTEPKP
jgi:hypothetical protein